MRRLTVVDSAISWPNITPSKPILFLNHVGIISDGYRSLRSLSDYSSPSSCTGLCAQMVRRSMRVIKENIFDSVAQESFERREKKHSSRSELEKVKTQEKFGTKHQRPCALCERYFSEVNLVQTVPFKASCARSRSTSLIVRGRFFFIRNVEMSTSAIPICFHGLSTTQKSPEPLAALRNVSFPSRHFVLFWC